jgi:hypothetical protein
LAAKVDLLILAAKAILVLSALLLLKMATKETITVLAVKEHVLLRLHQMLLVERVAEACASSQRT